jgi:hypothetical protein
MVEQHSQVAGGRCRVVVAGVVGWVGPQVAERSVTSRPPSPSRREIEANRTNVRFCRLAQPEMGRTTRKVNVSVS